MKIDNQYNTAERVRSEMKLLESRGFHYSHSAMKSGYLHRNPASVCIRPYKGKYGEGFIICCPCWVSTRYYYIYYFLK